MRPQGRPSELRAALGALQPYFRRAAGFSLFASLLMLSSSVYMLEVYDRVVNSRSHLTLAMLTLLVLCAYALMEVLDWVRSELMHDASVALDRRLSARIFGAVFEANLKRLEGGTAEQMSDFRKLRDFLSAPLLLALMEAPVALTFLVLIFLISPVLGWAAVVAAMAVTGVGWLNERGIRPPLLAANRHASAAQQYADASLRHAQVIEAMGMLGHIHQRWMDRQRKFLSLQATASEQAGCYQAISKFLQVTTSSALLGLGAWLLLHEQLNGGAAYMIIGSILGGRVLAPLVQIVAQWQTLVNARDAYHRLDGLLSRVEVHPTSMALPAPQGKLQVEALVAGPPGNPVPILKGLNFSLLPGEVLAVVGPSASGKTTLARLLLGLWPALNGKVRLDGVDVRSWDKHELGPHLGYLPQTVELFDGSLAENIARFGVVDAARVESAARAVGLHDFIMTLALGYEQPVGRAGALLSGGQRQRVGLARAIYGQPVLVVLDEPNSSLDEQGDLALADAIRQLKSKGVTFVVMTHRTSVLSVTDKMLVLRDGQAQCFGPRDEVLKALNEANAQPRNGLNNVPSSA